MPIPESQLDTWSHQGSIAQSSATYASIKNVLQDPGAPYASAPFDVFLQGSYGNDTNIYKESDVDVVIQLGDTFFYDLDRLREEEKSAFMAAYPSPTYPYPIFRGNVVSHLRSAFGSSVKEGTKAVKISPSGSRRSADVLIAASYRRYHRFRSRTDESYDSGLLFFTSAGERVANYPRQHSANCTGKHQATGSGFKPMVRIFKNLRSRLVADGLLASGVAPSYYVEALLYNVPDEKFGGSYQESFVEILTWLQKANRSEFVCANEQYYLLRDDPHVTWSSASCESFLDAIVKAWNAW